MKITKKQLQEMIQQALQEQSVDSFYVRKTATKVSQDIDELKRVFQYVQSGIDMDDKAPVDETKDCLDIVERIHDNLKNLIE